MHAYLSLLWILDSFICGIVLYDLMSPNIRHIHPVCGDNRLSRFLVIISRLRTPLFILSCGSTTFGLRFISCRRRKQPKDWPIPRTIYLFTYRVHGLNIYGVWFIVFLLMYQILVHPVSSRLLIIFHDLVSCLCFCFGYFFLLRFFFETHHETSQKHAENPRNITKTFHLFFPLIIEVTPRTPVVFDSMLPLFPLSLRPPLWCSLAIQLFFVPYPTS